MPGKEHYDRRTFFDLVRSDPFPGNLSQGQVDGMNEFLDYWEESPFEDRRWLAYTLGTQPIETAWTMDSIEEIGRGRGRFYGKPHSITGHIYYGRGRAQLTLYDNYKRATNEINSRGLVSRQIDLINHPEQALEPDISSAVLIVGSVDGWFRKDRSGRPYTLERYFNDKTTDWINARNIINGKLDRAHDIAAHAQAFYKALTAAATDQEPSQPDTSEPEASPIPAELAALIDAAPLGADICISVTVKKKVSLTSRIDQLLKPNNGDGNMQGTKSLFSSLGIMGPGVSLLVMLANQFLFKDAIITEPEVTNVINQASALFGLISGMIGRFRATKVIG